MKCWCDFGANLVQHFIKRYSRYSRYRTKTHDKSTISHDITRYSRYQTVLLKLQEITFDLWSNTKMLCFGRAFFRLLDFLEILWYNYIGEWTYPDESAKWHCQMHKIFM